MEGKKTGKVVKTNKNNKEKTKLIMGIAMMVFAVAISAGTYAYYQSTITGTVSGTILAWNCANSGTTSSGNLSIGDLKPGSSGSFTFKATSTNFKFDVTIQMKYANTANVPGNFKLFKDSAHSTSIAMATTGGTNATAVTAFSDTGIAKGNTGKTYTVYYYWPIGTTAETPIATGTANKTLTINYTITCKQSATQ